MKNRTLRLMVVLTIVFSFVIIVTNAPQPKPLDNRSEIEILNDVERLVLEMDTRLRSMDKRLKTVEETVSNADQTHRGAEAAHR